VTRMARRRKEHWLCYDPAGRAWPLLEDSKYQNIVSPAKATKGNSHPCAVWPDSQDFS
jgi:hypothetical protein